MKHTPGPWKVDGHDNDEVTTVDGCMIASVYPGYQYPDNGKPWDFPIATANARLIAAAPELLASGAELNALVELAQNVLARHLPPDGISMDEAIGELLELFDGPKQRLVQSGWRAVITKAGAK